MQEIIGHHFRIELLEGGGEQLAQILPRTGTVVRRLKALNDVDDWYLLSLDEVFEFQYWSKETNFYKLLVCKEMLIRSRWQGVPLGGREPPSVFILLILDDVFLEKEPIDTNDYLHIAWGMAYKTRA
jgi:hypothetical protein